MSALDDAACAIDAPDRTTRVNGAAKDTVQALYRLMEITGADDDGGEERAAELKRGAVQLVSATKGMMKDALDAAHQQQFKAAARQIESALEKVFLASG